METKKVLSIIFSLLFVGAFAFVLSWGIINFNKVKDGMSGTGVYTQEDINKSYEDGYNTALTDKEEYTKLIASYRDTITTLNDNISQLNSQVTILQNNNKDYSNQIDKLNIQKSTLETQVDNLTTIKTNNETTIASLNSQITSLQNQVTNLTNSSEDKSEQITTLNNQIKTLQNTVSQLQTTNDMNVATITSLNTQIANLNTQISNMTLQSQTSQSQINALNDKINELQASVTYYESYIAQLENGEQVVATFEFDGSVYNIQIVNKGSKLSVTTPTSTAYKIFNGWTVNGSAIDLSTYIITTNTKIVADVTYKYDVKFKVDDTIYNSQIITKNNCATLPTNPTKSGYEFDGWSLNGVDVISDITSRQVTQNVTYTAVFTKLHTVTFIYEDATKATQSVRSGNYATAITIEDTAYKVFNGWTVNGSKIDLSTYKIVTNTTFIADIIYKYDVDFKVDDTIYNSQIVAKNNCATLPTNPTKSGYEFDGWSLNGVDIISDITTIQVTENTTYFAVFTKLYTVKFMNGNTVVSTQSVRNGGYVTLPISPIKAGYIFNGWSKDGVNIISNITSINITENTTYIAIFMQKTLEQCSWSEIKTISDNGQATQMFNVGDEKNITLTNGNVLTIVILDFNHDTKSDGSGKAGITFGLKSLMADKYKMNSSNTNIGGWGASELRTTLNSDIFNTLPTELRSAICSVDKSTSSYDKQYGTRALKTTSDKLFLFSAIEICGSTYTCFSNEGSQYSFFKDKDNSYLYSYKLNNGTGDYRRWWLRSIGDDNNYNGFVYSGTNYKTSYITDISGGTWDGAGCQFGVCFGFCI